MITMTSPQQHIWHVKAMWALFLKREMQVELTHTRSDHWPYLCMETHTYWDLMRKNTPCVNVANCLSILLRDSHCSHMSIIHVHRNTFLVILWSLFYPSLSPSLSPAPLYLCLNRSLSRHQDTNQEFLAVGTGSLVKEWEKKTDVLL